MEVSTPSYESPSDSSRTNLTCSSFNQCSKAELESTVRAYTELGQLNVRAKDVAAATTALSTHPFGPTGSVCRLAMRRQKRSPVSSSARPAWSTTLPSSLAEALRSRVRDGRIAGGSCYGYRLERKSDGSGRKYTVASVNEAEAPIVRRIYDECLAGRGLKQIAHRLNNEGIPAPSAGRRGSGSWAPGAVRDPSQRPVSRRLPSRPDQEASPGRHCLPHQGRPSRGHRDGDPGVAHRRRRNLVRRARAVRHARFQERGRDQARNEVRADGTRALRDVWRRDRLAPRAHVRRRRRAHDGLRLLAPSRPRQRGLPGDGLPEQARGRGSAGRPAADVRARRASARDGDRPCTSGDRGADPAAP